MGSKAPKRTLNAEQKYLTKQFTSTHHKGDIEVLEDMTSKIMMQKVHEMLGSQEKRFIDKKPRFRILELLSTLTNHLCYWQYQECYISITRKIINITLVL